MTRANTPGPEDTLARAGRLVALLATLTYAALIVLVSLVPARIDPGAAHLATQFRSFLSSLVEPQRTIHNLRDLVTNFVLYVPLGVLLPWTFQSRRWRLTGVLAGAGLSACLEFAQAFTNRYPTAWDIVMNGAGHAAAYVLVTAVIARAQLSAALFVGGRAGTPRRRLAGGLRVILIGLTLLLALLPYNISVSASDVFAKLHGTLPAGGRIFLDPFSPWNMARATSLLTTLLIFVSFGFLSAFASDAGRSWARVALMGALLSAGVEGAQVVVRSRSSDIMQVLLAGVGAALGMAIGRAWDRTHSDAARTRVSSGVSRRAPDYWLIATLLYAMFLWVIAWRPFVFVASPREAIRRLIFDTYWLPIRSYLNQERSLEIWRDLARESSLWAPLGVLLQVLLAGTHWHPRVPRPAVAFAFALVWGSFVELGQALVIDRVPDSTDILSHVLGVMAGYILASALHR